MLAGVSIFLNRSLLLKRKKESRALNKQAPECPFLSLEQEAKLGHRQMIFEGVAGELALEIAR